MLPALCREGEPYVFLGYAPRDREAVAAIADRLSRAGVPLWHDEDRGYENIDEEEVTLRLRECSAFLFFLSQKESGPFLIKAFHYALFHNRPVIPVFLDDAQLPKGQLLLLSDSGDDARAVFLRDSDFGEKLLAAVLPLIPSSHKQL